MTDIEIELQLLQKKLDNLLETAVDAEIKYNALKESYVEDLTFMGSLRREAENKIAGDEKEIDWWHEACHTMEGQRDEWQRLCYKAIKQLAPYLDADTYICCLREE